MTDISARLSKSSFASTFRVDNWWVGPLAVFLGFTAFIVYVTWASFQGNHYFVGAGGFGGYLSPFYSPLIYIQEGVAGAAPMSHALLGSWPEWWPAFLPASPAFFILMFPGLFRFTCYYYRGAYYKAFAATPPACAVGGIPQKKYLGETFLLLFQNLHRYALYFALLYIPILSYDAILAFFRDGQFGMGVGTLILVINPILIACYTLGCHSFRHLVGGRKDCFSCEGSGKIRHGVYQKVSWLNSHHKLFAWLSLVWVMWTDIYIRLVSYGTITDLNTWGI